MSDLEQQPLLRLCAIHTRHVLQRAVSVADQASAGGGIPTPPRQRQLLHGVERVGRQGVECAHVAYALRPVRRDREDVWLGRLRRCACGRADALPKASRFSLAECRQPHHRKWHVFSWREHVRHCRLAEHARVAAGQANDERLLGEVSTSKRAVAHKGVGVHEKGRRRRARRLVALYADRRWLHR
eukprot:4713932-Prymnesium_polylepis.1